MHIAFADPENKTAVRCSGAVDNCAVRNTGRENNHVSIVNRIAPVFNLDFYISYQNEHPDEEVDKEAFQYPGPNPFTKEQAILMMADAVEAASRSLKSYTEESISTLVDKIIDGQVQDGFFKECPITFKDIATVKSVFKEKLKTMYHTRISYPELKK